MGALCVSMEPLLTTRQVAERFRVRPETVAKWVADGKLAVVQKMDGLRGPMLFDPTTVDQFATDRDGAA